MGFGPCGTFFVFGKNRTFICRKSHSYLIVQNRVFAYHIDMEKLIETLMKIGICPESIEEIKQMDAERAHECAALLIAQYDDRHEYLD